MSALRQVLVSFVGHVDHGKSSILDRIRGTTIVEREAGLITQAIGASIIPMKTIRRVCGNLLSTLKIEITIPGLLAIDTPGHAAFVHLRKRGGNLADIAVVVIDINEGVMPQTSECFEILKQYKTPFIVASNKIDLIHGWRATGKTLTEAISMQADKVQVILDTKVYQLVSSLSKFGFDSERFDRVSDFTKQIVIIPVSAKTGDGIPELLMMLTGLAQKFLEEKLKFSETSMARGTVLEVKEDKGMGKTLDVILYDGTLRKNDTIVIGGIKEPIVAKVKALFEPEELAEMRDKKSRFIPVESVVAATGVKISSSGVEDVVAGMPLMSADNNIEEVKKLVQREVEEVIIEKDKEGIVIKADNLGSLEAMTNILKEKKITIKRTSIGDIAKKDIADAEANLEKEPLKAVVLGFNVSLPPNLSVPQNVKVITNNVIYKLVEELENWQCERLREQEKGSLDLLVKPSKLQILRGYVFRQSNPAIVGVEVLAGNAKVGTSLMTAIGNDVTSIKSLQFEQESINEAEQGKKVAVSLERVTVGRQIKEGDILYSSIPEQHFRKMKELKKYLSRDIIELLKEIAEIKRKENPIWGI